MRLPAALERLRAAVASLDDEPPAGTPLYDPVHVGGVLVSVMAAWGALYWLLWTLLVYEGGVFVKLGALARLAGGSSLAELGYEGPWNRGPFEGWLGTLGAAVLAAVVASALRSEWRRAECASRARR